MVEIYTLILKYTCKFKGPRKDKTILKKKKKGHSTLLQNTVQICSNQDNGIRIEKSMKQSGVLKLAHPYQIVGLSAKAQE